MAIRKKLFFAPGLLLALAALAGCPADVKTRVLRGNAPEPTFSGADRQWQPYIPRNDDQCLSVDVDTITGPWDKIPDKEPARCTVRLLIPDGTIPQHKKINVVELKFEQGDRLCYLLKRSQKLILVYGPDGNLRAVEDHYPPVPTRITE